MIFFQPFCPCYKNSWGIERKNWFKAACILILAPFIALDPEQVVFFLGAKLLYEPVCLSLTYGCKRVFILT